MAETTTIKAVKPVKSDGLNEASKGVIALLEKNAAEQGDKLRAGYERGFITFPVPVTAENCALAVKKVTEQDIKTFSLSVGEKTGKTTARVRATTDAIMTALNAVYCVEGSDEKADLLAVYDAIRHRNDLMMAYHALIKAHLTNFGGQVLAIIGE